MRYAILAAFVAIFIGPENALAQERGIFSTKATIVKASKKTLQLSVVDQAEVRPPSEPIPFEIADDAKFEEVDYKIVDGKLQTTRKAIGVGDLAPLQTIHVIGIVVDRQATILYGVVAGGSASGAEGIKLIAKLGGSIKNITREKNDIRYDVNLSDSKVTDEDLAVIATIDNLHFLDLSNTQITVEGIAQLAKHPKLQSLTLSGTKVTNGALRHLGTLSKLDDVRVDRTDVTRDAILDFAKQKNLSSFSQISAGPKGEYSVHEILHDDRGGRHPPSSYVYLMKRSVYYGRFYPDDESARRKPTTYYHRDGPVGAVLRRFEWFPRHDFQDKELQDVDSCARLPASVAGLSCFSPGGLPMDALASLWSEPALGVVELNTGTIAAYGRPFQTIDFYNDLPELVPFNLKVGGKEPPFGFVQDALERGSNVRVIDGNFKKSVRKDAPTGFYSAIFIDITVQQREDPKAITKDDVHFDIMTQEGMAELMDKTTPDGVLCYHTSHRTHEFPKPLAAAASKLGFAWILVNDNTYLNDGRPAFGDDSHFNSEWLVIARTKEHLARFRTEKSRTRNLTWSVPRTDPAAEWRDGVEPKMPIRPR